MDNDRIEIGSKKESKWISICCFIILFVLIIGRAL